MSGRDERLSPSMPFLNMYQLLEDAFSHPLFLCLMGGNMVSIRSIEITNSFRRVFLGTNSKILHHIPEYQGILDLCIERVFHSPMPNKKILFLFRSNMTQCS
jgi:hypothetical protein